MTHVLTQTTALNLGRNQSVLQRIATWFLNLDQSYRSKQHMKALTDQQLSDVGLSRDDVNKH